MLAISLYEPEPGPQWYTDDNMHSPKVLDMVKKVKKADGAQDADLNHEFRNYWNGYWMPVQVEIVTTGKQRFSGHATYPKGHPANPLTHDDLRTKFRYAASAVLQQNRIDEIISTIERLEDVSDMAQLVTLLH
jgi:2-methylcitrate dehydratase PrpD